MSIDDTGGPPQGQGEPPAPLPFYSAVLLAENNRSLVSGFTCSRPGHGEDRWEKDVSDWITNPGRGGAMEAIRLGLAEVGLFLHSDGRLIGFGAIGPDLWELGDGESIPVWLLHHFAVHTNFRHQPHLPREARYGRRILAGLIQEVERRGGRPYFALYVDPANPARKLYEEVGFHVIDEWPDPELGGRLWVRMARPIT